MAPLINAREVTQSFGAQPLFRNISLSINEGERLGLIGPNGSGKSTLLEILAGHRAPDAGEIAIRKNTRIGYVAQDSQFASDISVRSVVRMALERSNIPVEERLGRESEVLGRVGFTDFDQPAASLSGGWRKRLAIAEALAETPDVLLLDEPTNHLDLTGIEWLEKFVLQARFACVVVSHDRYFLENVATSVVELSRAYPDGLYRVSGSYSRFLEAKEDYLAAQSKRQEALENRVRTELEWLRRGPKARATKAKARIDKANTLINELREVESRSRSSTAGIDFAATDRKTKRLIELADVSFSFGNKPILRELNFTVTARMRVGLVGPNGSGKTTLLRLLTGALSPDRGSINRADLLRVVYFEQIRSLDPDLTLRRALAPDGDSIVFGDRTIHVASWAARFLFTAEQLNQPVGKLSGGERARVLIANLMRQPADILILDEPTNDLDIPTLEILEENLLDFPGALILVTHDRFLLDRVANVVLGLDGEGGAETFADYSQCEKWMEDRSRRDIPALQPARVISRDDKPARKKLSYLENREYESIEERIASAEAELTELRKQLEEASLVRDPTRLAEIYREIEQRELEVNSLYDRWAALEEKLS